MLFNIECDRGDCIIGYVVPDGYTGTAKLEIYVNHRAVLEIETSDPRPALVAAGRHQSGRCGFILDASILPDISKISNLEIFESSTGILIYRRSAKENVKRKILRIDTHFFPLRKFDQSLSRFFHYYNARIERWGGETINQLFLLNGIDSIFLSGRIMYRSFQQYIDERFNVFIIVQDPYVELAERILTMKVLSKRGGEVLSERENILFAPAIAYVENLLLTDMGTLKRSIATMPRDVAAILSNPVVRQLTASTLDEMPHRFSVASALDMLSTCELIGLRDDPTTIKFSAANAIGIDPESIDIQNQIPSVWQLGMMLRDIGSADTFLEKDIELYQYVVDAAQRVRQGGGDANVAAG
ncbi:MAG TPA: hypothetical protein VGU72_15510 [Beijerinckiaceae bacterium]|jgi:hypothetical protein|nr:hypothetical protein [Beijerinckiaceae bacterium]